MYHRGKLKSKANGDSVEVQGM